MKKVPDRTIATRKVIGGGGGGGAKYRKSHARENREEKIYSQRVARKKCSCIRKKYSCKRAARKFPNPNNFSKGPSLND